MKSGPRPRNRTEGNWSVKCEREPSAFRLCLKSNPEQVIFVLHDRFDWPIRRIPCSCYCL